MPSFERVVKELKLAFAPDEAAKRELLAYYRGLDRARWEILTVVIVAAVIALAVLATELACFVQAT